MSLDGVVLPAEELKVMKQGEEMIILHTGGIEAVKAGKISQGSCCFFTEDDCLHYFTDRQISGARKCNEIIKNLTEELK